MPAHVRMTEHSLIRADQRLGRRVKNELEKSLKAGLRSGMVPDERGAIHPLISDGEGVLMASPLGGWDCVTILRR